MALATRCPNCDVLFRVVSDQLKLRGGLVRCGSCRHVFDAIGSLTYVDEQVLSGPAAFEPHAGKAALKTPETPAAPAADTGPVQAPRIEPRIEPRDDKRDNRLGDKRDEKPDSPRDLPGHEASDENLADDDPTNVPTLLVVPDQPVEDDVAPAVDTAPKAAQDTRATSAPARADDETEDVEDTAAPAFLREPTRADRIRASLLSVAAAVLSLAMVAQLGLLWRTELAVAFPSMRPLLADACMLAGCKLEWPKRVDLLAVVGSELQAFPGTDALEVNAVVRNRASHTVALPAVEVTLSDVERRTLVRKVVTPVEYLAAAGEPLAKLDEGIEAGADVVIRFTVDAGNLPIDKFVVYPFYP